MLLLLPIIYVYCYNFLVRVGLESRKGFIIHIHFIYVYFHPDIRGALKRWFFWFFFLHNHVHIIYTLDNSFFFKHFFFIRTPKSHHVHSPQFKITNLDNTRVVHSFLMFTIFCSSANIHANDHYSIKKLKTTKSKFTFGSIVLTSVIYAGPHLALCQPGATIFLRPPIFLDI